MADEILAELWKTKDAIANEHGCDVKALAAQLRAKEHEADKPVIDLRSIKNSIETRAQTDPQ